MSRKPQAIPQPPPGFWVAALCAIAVQLGLVHADIPLGPRRVEVDVDLPLTHPIGGEPE